MAPSLEAQALPWVSLPEIPEEQKIMNRKEPYIPALPAYKVTLRVWAVWCEHEGIYHTHSAGDGHRAAHCTDPTSPYRDTGYTIIYQGLWRDRPVHELCGQRHQAAARRCPRVAKERETQSTER